MVSSRMSKHKAFWRYSLCLILMLSLTSCHDFTNCQEVNGGQGVFVIDDQMYINGSAQISLYHNGELIKQNKNVFTKYQGEVNHLGALSGNDRYLFAPAEAFDGNDSINKQVGIYDRHTLKQVKAFPLAKQSGQQECSALAYDDRDHSLWLTQWGDTNSSFYLYHYDLNGQYLGKRKIPPLKWIQGLTVYKNDFYFACDDGDANKDQPDHIYELSKAGQVKTIRLLDDVYDQGEVEGLSIAHQNLYVLYNRGAKVVDGKVLGLEKGYDHQIHEVNAYKLK